MKSIINLPTDKCIQFPNNILYAGNGIINNPMTISSSSSNGYNIGYGSEDQYYNYKVCDQIDIEKSYLKLLKKIEKIDPEAKELKNNANMYYSSKTLISKSFLSEKIWNQSKLKIEFITISGYISSLSVYKDYTFLGSNIKMYACYQLPILSKLGNEYLVQNSKILEEKNKNIAKKVSKEISLFLKNNQLKISSESEISETLSDYINFL